jgi:hypothetical protein
MNPNSARKSIKQLFLVILSKIQVEYSIKTQNDDPNLTFSIFIAGKEKTKFNNE